MIPKYQVLVQEVEGQFTVDVAVDVELIKRKKVVDESQDLIYCLAPRRVIVVSVVRTEISEYKP